MKREGKDRFLLCDHPFSLFILLFVFLLIVNIRELALPLFWDEIFGLHNQALFLAKHHWKISLLFQEGQTYGQGGSAVYPLGILPYLCSVLYALFSPETVRILCRLISISCSAVTGVLTFRMGVQSNLSPHVSLLGTIAFLLTPLYSAQTGAAGQEIIMGMLIMFSLWFFWNDRFWKTMLFACAACMIKLTAVILFPACAVWYLSAFLHGKKRSSGIRFLFTCIIFAAVLLPNRLFSIAMPTGFSGHFLQKFPVVWEHSILFFPWLFLFCAAGVMVWLFSKDKIREMRSEIWIFPLVFCGFFAAYFLQTSMAQCPRYAAIVVMPAAFFLLYLFRTRSKNLQLCFFGSILILNLLNSQGLLLPEIPLLKRASGHYYERSRESFELARLHMRTASALEQEFPETQIVCGWPFPQELTVPEFGYVKKPLNIFTGKIFPKYANAKHLSELDFREPVYVLAETPVFPSGILFTRTDLAQVIREYHHPGEILLLSSPEILPQLRKYRESPEK